MHELYNIIVLRINNNNNNNNALINRNCGRLQELILLFKIPVGDWEDFFEINRHFGHAPS